MPCRREVWLPSDEAVCRFPCCGVARNRNGIPASGVPAAAFTSDRGGHVFIIGIDPHKGSHTAAVIDRDEQHVRGRSYKQSRHRTVVIPVGTCHVVSV